MCSLLPEIQERVQPDSTIYTGSYQLLSRSGFKHRTIAHSEETYARGDVHTNTIEGYFGLIKGGLQGVYRGAVRRHLLKSYLDEYSFRYNHRQRSTLARCSGTSLIGSRLTGFPSRCPVEIAWEVSNDLLEILLILNFSSRRTRHRIGFAF